MFFDSVSSQTMQGSMDALWLKMRVHASNISNASTPGYQAKKVSFGEVLKETESGEENAKKVVLRTTVTDDATISARIDGNNVNSEKEQIELWKAQAQYAYLTQKISGEYTNLRNVISTMSR